MKLDNNDAAVCDSIDAQAGAAEIDLYDELNAFAELSPEEQLRLVARPEKPSAEPRNASAENDVKLPLSEHVITRAALEHSTIAPGKSAATVNATASESDSKVAKTSIEPGSVAMAVTAGPRPSGPLSAFNLPPELVYTGALSRGVCLACGSESGADDLFCLTCGVFIDEIGSTLPPNPTCGDCNGRIDADEIFCPWCGSAMPA